MEPRAKIGSNLDSCERGPTLLKLMFYEHWEDTMGVGGSRQWQTHTQTVSPVIHWVDGASGNDR